MYFIHPPLIVGWLPIDNNIMYTTFYCSLNLQTATSATFGKAAPLFPSNRICFLYVSPENIQPSTTHPLANEQPLRQTVTTTTKTQVHCMCACACALRWYLIGRGQGFIQLIPDFVFTSYLNLILIRRTAGGIDFWQMKLTTDRLRGKRKKALTFLNKFTFTTDTSSVTPLVA